MANTEKDGTYKGIVSYTSRDYESIMNDFWDMVPKLTDVWKPEADADPGAQSGSRAGAADEGDVRRGQGRRETDGLHRPALRRGAVERGVAAEGRQTVHEARDRSDGQRVI